MNISFNFCVQIHRCNQTIARAKIVILPLFPLRSTLMRGQCPNLSVKHGGKNECYCLQLAAYATSLGGEGGIDKADNLVTDGQGRGLNMRQCMHQL